MSISIVHLYTYKLWRPTPYHFISISCSASYQDVRLQIVTCKGGCKILTRSSSGGLLDLNTGIFHFAATPHTASSRNILCVNCHLARRFHQIQHFVNMANNLAVVGLAVSKFEFFCGIRFFVVMFLEL